MLGCLLFTPRSKFSCFRACVSMRGVVCVCAHTCGVLWVCLCLSCIHVWCGVCASMSVWGVWVWCGVCVAGHAHLVCVCARVVCGCGMHTCVVWCVSVCVVCKSVWVCGGGGWCFCVQYVSIYRVRSYKPNNPFFQVTNLKGCSLDRSSHRNNMGLFGLCTSRYVWCMIRRVQVWVWLKVRSGGFVFVFMAEGCVYVCVTGVCVCMWN